MALLSSNMPYPPAGKYLLLSQYFKDASKYNLAEDLQLNTSRRATFLDLKEQESLIFAERVVSHIVEAIVQDLPPDLIYQRVFYTSHDIREISTGQVVTVVALVLGPFKNLNGDGFWKYLVERGNTFLPSS
eukprot:CAMPEP_0178937808 /NCGR_PEP_ID=MMETSP0786-20121207/25975_1 /TAXON_ID=186022 /ORGANISM="Thalassionema frauenfeldii, Strain CCMP 1798" /LENGTH=130 /DNA_ID=CAMNT_0020616445 /DNA_START=36 /DNA_END=424 /DNA_ORIENTATION=+